jgi:hypothetical protein
VLPGGISHGKMAQKNRSYHELKLKGSLGWTGNQNISDFASLGLWSGGGVYDDESGLIHSHWLILI